uniref:PX domain-containing protein n=1 Tax=Meleagris gallopavo TaxID=9103 RepID=G1MQG8_MELGA
SRSWKIIKELLNLSPIRTYLVYICRLVSFWNFMICEGKLSWSLCNLEETYLDLQVIFKFVSVLPNIWSTDGELTIPEQKQVENNEELASSYERKLIEVAEMHGELIEFNERLHRALMAKEALVSQMRQELIDLRGPVPGDLSQTSEDQSLSDFEISNRALINVWIPSVFLRGKAANAFHVYQVYIRIKDDEWNVYRRYAEFRSLHHKLQSKYHQVRTFNFPPKKAIGNKVSEKVTLLGAIHCTPERVLW